MFLKGQKSLIFNLKTLDPNSKSGYKARLSRKTEGL